MSDRELHLLRQTKGSKRPSNVIFFDTETNRSSITETKTKHSLRLGYAQHCRTLRGKRLKRLGDYEIRDIEGFWDKVEQWIRSKTTTLLVAHNLLFDLVVMDGIKQLQDRGWELEGFYSKSFVSIFRWSKGSKKLVGLDNSNFFKGKLEEWGKQFGYPKLEIDFDTCTHDELLIYCKRDVDIMVEGWLQWLAFLDEHDCGNFKFTLASTAFNTWRYRFMPTKVIIHAEDKVLELERASYKGGRTEVLFQGYVDDSTYYYLDVNNLYAHVLKTYQYPCALYGHRDNKTLQFLEDKLAKYAVVAKVRLQVNDNWYPYKVFNHTAYPIGEFTTTLTTGELKLAIAAKWVREVQEIAWYRKAHLFKDYVDYFYTLRQSYEIQGKTSFNEICKLLLNSLYGKFGQKGIVQEVIGECDPYKVGSEYVYDMVDDLYYRIIYLAGKVYREYTKGESFNSFPVIASHVTAYARLHITDLMKKVTPKHVFYMDTDSLIVDQQGYNELRHLINPNELGMLKVELQSPWLRINAPKDYAMLNRLRTKGISRKAKQLSEGVYEQTHWIRLAGMIRDGDISSYYTNLVTRQQRRIVHSGLVDRLGWVHPFDLPMG